MRLAKYLLAAGLVLTPLFAPGLTFAAAPTTKPSSAKAKAEQAPIVAVFRFDSDLAETPGEGFVLFGGKPKASLRDITGRIRKAADDPNVKAVVLLSEGGAIGIGQLEEVRQALDLVKKAGKPIYVHAEGLALRDYALLSCADHIGVVPTGDVFITGIYAEAPYIRGLLDKVGVHPDFLHCGDWKSYAEMYMREGPSKEADEMQNWLLDGIYDDCIDLIAKGRKVDSAKVKQWIDEAPYSADKAKSIGLIDAVEQLQDFEAMILEKTGAGAKFEKSYGQPKQQEMDLSSPFAFFNVLSEMMNGAKNKPAPTKPSIAIVYVDGEISLGAGEDSPFSAGGGAHSSDLRKALDQAANDDNIKAVVLRVDSPGGSATASEIILDATKRVKAKKPLIVSMGNVAGSGGYYVTCASDMIFADRGTITASIGVVGGKMVTNDMWAKVGVTFKEYSRGKNAGIMSTGHVWNDDERVRVMDWMNDVYGVFKDHVVAARGSKLKKPIDQLAGGRVFTGQQALELGLVDKIGTLQDAIEYTASNAKLGSDYEVRVVPEPKNFIEKIMEQNAGANDDPNHVLASVTLGVARAAVRQMSSQSSIVDLAMPYLQNLDPQRVAKIKAALHMLDMMQDQGVILTTPQLMMSK